MGPDRTLTLTLSGRLDVDSITPIWRKVAMAVARTRARHVIVDASRLEHCDSAGLALFVDLERRLQRRRGKLELVGLPEPIAQRLAKFASESFPPPKSTRARRTPFLEEVGRSTVAWLADMRDQIAFVGELSVALGRVLVRPRRLRLREALIVTEKVGANALPIIALIGFLIGLIMSFQSAQPLRRFGAELYVADLVSISTVRELGPLMTAIVLAGRSGTAFAAELGTMKVDEELDALTTMGLDPVRFLAVTRVIAAIVAMPLLTLCFHLCALVGGAIVLMSLGFPLVTYTRQVVQAVELQDLWGGLAKSLVYGLLVASVGCLRGFQTAHGPSAVGDAATRAVVTGIVLIIVADGVFSVLYHRLGI